MKPMKRKALRAFVMYRNYIESLPIEQHENAIVCTLSAMLFCAVGIGVILIIG